MEFQVKIIHKGISRATTYLDADSVEDIFEGLRDLVDDAESGENDWLEGVFEDEDPA